MRASPWTPNDLTFKPLRRLGSCRPQNSPYSARHRTEAEVRAGTGMSRHYKYCIVDRYDEAVFLFTTVEEARFVAEKINVNMAKEVLKAP